MDAKELIKVVGTSIADISAFEDVLWGVAEDDIQDRFASSPLVRSTAAVYGGTVWPRLTELYIVQNNRTGQQLIDTGELRQSFRSGQPGNIKTSDSSKVSFGSSLKKAEYQNNRRRLVVEHGELVEKAAIAIARQINSLTT